MTESHPYPERGACDWTVAAGDGELLISPSDQCYRAAREKRITVAIRGVLGFLNYKIKANLP